MISRPPPPPSGSIQDTVRESIASMRKRPFPIPGGWRISIGGGRRGAVLLAIAGSWLTLRTPSAGAHAPAGSGAGSPSPSWGLLELNARLSGRVKFLARRSTEPAVLGADLPLGIGETPPLPAMLDDALEGMRAAWPALRGTPVERVLEELHRARPTRRRPGPAPAEPVAEALGAEGWSFEEREGGALSVALPRPFSQRAEVTCTAGGGVHVGATLARIDEQASVRRDAVGRMLLEANSAVRMVRAAVQRGDGCDTLLFEARFDRRPVAAELSTALGACALACDLYLREVQVLIEDERCARAFLALRSTTIPRSGVATPA
ncbi:MAG: hypothetical protein ACE5GW_04590 [Planctomycetota bacterium]